MLRFSTGIAIKNEYKVWQFSFTTLLRVKTLIIGWKGPNLLVLIFTNDP